MTYPIDTTPASPNHSSRAGADISMLVLHATVGSYASSLAWLCNPQTDHPNLRVSTHYLIRKDGYINQLVSDARAAWHAGKSSWMGMDGDAIQRRSLGIELENANNGRDPYPPAQLRAAHWLCQSLIARYNIERADVVRHLDIAIPRGRKTDPAGLPWPAFADSLYLDSPPTLYPRYVVTSPCAIFTSRSPSAPLASGPDNGQTHLAPGDIVNVGDVTDGWLWVSPNASDPPGIGFVPASYARAV